MTIYELLGGGGALVAAFRWLTVRDRLATQTLVKTLEDAERRVKDACARADAAELESSRERERRIRAEEERDAERARRINAERERDELATANEGLRNRVEGLYGTVSQAVDRIAALEGDLNSAHKELARRAVDEERAGAVGKADQTGPFRSVKGES